MRPPHGLAACALAAAGVGAWLLAACTALMPLDDHAADDGGSGAADRAEPGDGTGTGDSGFTPDDPSRPNYVFVSSGTFDPSALGDHDGGVRPADEACARMAADAGLPGAYVAYLSTSKLPA